MPIYQSEQYDGVIGRLKLKIADKQLHMGKPLSEEEILHYENHCKIRLPEAYRRFLKEIGDGCSMLDGLHLTPLSDMEWEDLSKPFMLENDWIWEDEDVCWNSVELMVYNGNIELILLGDCMSYNLIVTGKCRGEVWFFTDVGVQPCCQRQDFFGWFEKWLNIGDAVDYFSEYKYE